MTSGQAQYFTFSFYVDPELNKGYTEVFKQGSEPWWWYVVSGSNEPPSAGPTPNFTGAKFKSLHQWDQLILGDD